MLLKDCTRYDLVEPKNTIVCWVKACIDELVKEEIRFGIQVDKNNFKVAFEVFKNQWKIVENEIKKSK